MEKVKKLKLKNKKRDAFYVICCVILAVYCFVLFSMFVWALLSSFKTTDGIYDEFNDTPLALPNKIGSHNIISVLNNLEYKTPALHLYLEDMVLNSVLYSIGCATASVLVCSLTAYAVSQFKFKFSDIIYAVVIFTMVFPVIGSAPSEMQFVNFFGLRNKIWGMYILKANFLGMYFLIFYAGFSAIPKTYREAAQIDGASNWAIMTKIHYPLMIGSILSIWLLYFISYWNDYQTPLLYMPNNPTISYGLFLYTEKGYISVPEKLTACFFVFLPMFIVFLIFREKLMGDISLDGGVKG